MRKYAYGILGLICLIALSACQIGQKPSDKIENGEPKNGDEKTLFFDTTDVTDITDQAYGLPFVYAMPQGFHPDFQDSTSTAAKYLMTWDEQHNVPNQPDVLSLMIAFFQDQRGHPLINVTTQTYADQAFHIKYYQHVLELGEGCSLMMDVGWIDPRTGFFLSACMGVSYPTVTFPFRDTHFRDNNVFGIAAAKRSTERGYDPNNPLVQNVIEQDSSLTGVIAVSSVDIRDYANARNVIEQQMRFLHIPQDCYDELVTHPNFAMLKISALRFTGDTLEERPWPAALPPQCFKMPEDVFNVAQNIIANGCSHQYYNCSILGANFKGYVTGEPCPADSDIGRYNPFTYFDPDVSEHEAFYVPVMFVKRNNAWFAGAVDAMNLPRCDFQGYFPDADALPSY